MLKVHDNYAMLMPNWVSGYSSAAAVCLLFGIPIPAIYKVTESVAQLATMHLPVRLFCGLSFQ